MAKANSVESPMPNLIVRNVDAAVVKALKARAGKKGTSAEAEHREILRQVLLGPKRRTFAEVLASMPNVGRDEDFARIEDTHEHPLPGRHRRPE
jgi:plasmid stability protein